MEAVYKIVEMSEFGNYKTLFHGIMGTKLLPRGVWIQAVEKLVVDGSGGKCYLSGIHCFKDKEIAENYFTKFREVRDRIIIRCYAKNLRVKPTNKYVFLASEIFIPKQNI